MEMIDWNWVYSALAQSAAAIVGFIGGFIAIKILGLSSFLCQKAEAIPQEIYNYFARGVTDKRELPFHEKTISEDGLVRCH